MPTRLTFAREVDDFSLLFWVELTMDFLFVIDIGVNFRAPPIHCYC